MNTYCQKEHGNKRIKLVHDINRYKKALVGISFLTKTLDRSERFQNKTSDINRTSASLVGRNFGRAANDKLTIVEIKVVA